MVLAAVVVASVYHDHNYECVITSATEGSHSIGSLHYSGEALDFRTNHIPLKVVLDQMVTDIKLALGGDFDVVLEQDHLHVEFQPKVSY